MQESLYDFCIANRKETLLSQWDREKNAPLTPSNVSQGSHKKVFWRCENNHVWNAAVYARTEGSGCPYCTGRKVMSDFNDLASVNPSLAAQWDSEKNAPLKPEHVSIGSHRSVWWRCESGHSWHAIIRSRSAGCGCPYCTGKKISQGENDLATKFPALAAQWDTERNASLRPQDVLPGSARKVWWRCTNGHSWQAPVSARTSVGRGCPYCAGKRVLCGYNDLASRNPVLAAQWDREKNKPLTPEDVTLTSNRSVWWQCARGHSYEARIATRANGSGCPYCTGRKALAGFNDLASREPKIAAEWHPTLNGLLTPQMVTTGSRKKVWWECAYGHVWKAAIYSRAGKGKCGCPVCAGMTAQPSA